MQNAKVLARTDVTDRTVREIISRETADRDAKTARLKKLRLAKEAEEQAVIDAAPPAPVKKSRRKAAAT